MSEKERMMQIWISLDAYRKLLAVRGGLMRLNGKTRTLDDGILELIEVWKRHFEFSP
jgi:predicted CopG family antitoxin